MKQRTRTFLTLLPLGLQALALMGALGIISFMVPVTTRVIELAESEVDIPAPSQLLVDNAGVAKFLLIAIFSVSVIAYFYTRHFIKEEAEQAIKQNAVYGIVWYVGITILGGMVLAALLPYFALHGPIQ